MREALRRLVVRLTGRPAPSVPPKNDPFDEFIKHSLRRATELRVEEIKRLVDRGVVAPEVLTLLGASYKPATSQPEAGIKPPSDPDAEGWTFAKWAAARDGEGHIPGWAYARFANSSTKADGSDTATFVFGFVRSAFGVWSTTFDICNHTANGYPERRRDMLTTITHLRSGYSIGIFADMAVAVEAAELAERVHPGWQTDRKPTVEGIERTITAWDAIGICAAIDAHAHSNDGQMLKINGRSMESIMDGKPERLS